MATHCMCTQANCDKATNCFHFTAQPEPKGQIYFAADPRDIAGRCRFYWREGGEFTLATGREG